LIALATSHSHKFSSNFRVAPTLVKLHKDLVTTVTIFGFCMPCFGFLRAVIRGFLDGFVELLRHFKQLLCWFESALANWVAATNGRMPAAPPAGFKSHPAIYSRLAVQAQIFQ
jgi:hypothetical protein